MLKIFFNILCGLCAGLITFSVALSADLPPSPLPSTAVPLEEPTAGEPWFSEVRLGLLGRNVNGGFIPQADRLESFDFSRMEDINAEILSRPLYEAYDGQFRLGSGITISTTGQENKYYNSAIWTQHLFDTPLFIEGSLGVAIHDGYLSNAPESFRNQGCRVQLHESASLGFDITANINIMATYEHMSNAGLCEHNAGLSHAGIRLGWKF